MGARTRGHGKDMVKPAYADVVWQPVKSRRRRPWLLLIIAGAIAVVGYLHITMAVDAPGVATTSPSAPPVSTARKQVHEQSPGRVHLSAAPRASPLPRQGVRPQRLPPPRGEMREAAVDSRR